MWACYSRSEQPSRGKNKRPPKTLSSFCSKHRPLLTFTGFGTPRPLTDRVLAVQSSAGGASFELTPVSVAKSKAQTAGVEPQWSPSEPNMTGKYVYIYIYIHGPVPLHKIL